MGSLTCASQGYGSRFRAPFYRASNACIFPKMSETHRVPGFDGLAAILGCSHARLFLCRRMTPQSRQLISFTGIPASLAVDPTRLIRLGLFRIEFWCSDFPVAVRKRTLFAIQKGSVACMLPQTFLQQRFAKTHYIRYFRSHTQTSKCIQQQSGDPVACLPY